MMNRLAELVFALIINAMRQAEHVDFSGTRLIELHTYLHIYIALCYYPVN
jgi:hypothetical protein